MYQPGPGVLNLLAGNLLLSELKKYCYLGSYKIFMWSLAEERRSFQLEAVVSQQPGPGSCILFLGLDLLYLVLKGAYDSLDFLAIKDQYEPGPTDPLEKDVFILGSLNTKAIIYKPILQMNLQLNKISRQLTQNAPPQRTGTVSLGDQLKSVNPPQSYGQKRARNQPNAQSLVPRGKQRSEEIEKRMRQMYERGKKNDSKRLQNQPPSIKFYKQNQRFYQQPPTLERNIESLNPRPNYDPQPLAPHPEQHISAVPKSSLPIKILSDEKESPYVDYESIAQAYKRYSQSSSISSSQLKQSNLMSQRQESKASWRAANKQFVYDRQRERVKDIQRQKRKQGQFKYQQQIKRRRQDQSRSRSPSNKRTPQMSCQVACSYCGVYKSPQISHHCPKLYSKQTKPAPKISLSNPIQKQTFSSYNSGHRTSSSSFNNFLNDQSYQYQKLDSKRTASKETYKASNSSLQRSWQRGWNHQLRDKSKQNYTRLRTMLGLGNAGKYRF